MTITRRGRLVEQTEREFVNREKCIELFENAIKNTRQTKYRVQVYYGVSGVGKSRLIGELQKVIEEYNLTASISQWIGLQSISTTKPFGKREHFS